MPKAPVIREPQDVPAIRKSIAYAYALGGNMLVPWDIYLPTPDAKRYFGDAAEYADLFSFVHEHAALLDSMDVAVASSIAGLVRDHALLLLYNTSCVVLATLC